MGVRVTSSMLLRTALANVARQRARLAVTQERASSGLRINRPSDDPVGIRLATQLRSDTRATEQFVRNVDQAASRLRSIETAVADAIDVVQRARELALQGANGTLDAASRQAIAAEVAALHDRLLAIANTRFTGASVFAGTGSGAAAFSSSGPFPAGGPPPTLSFDGDSIEIEVAAGDGVRVVSTLDGRRVFLGDADGDGSPDAGREDVFRVLGDLWQGLVNDDPAAVAATLDRLDAAQLQLSLEQVRVGALDGRLEAARNALGLSRTDLVRRLSEVEDADTVEVLSDLVSQETALRAALESASRLAQPSLLDFLR